MFGKNGVLKRVQHDRSTQFQFSLVFFSLRQQWVLLVLALLLLPLSHFRLADAPLPSEEKGTEVVVEISGEVLSPGIHLFQSPPTVREALEKAGGLNELPSPLVPAERLETGTLLTAVRENPGEIKVRVETMETSKLLAFSIPLDLNRVSSEDLRLVPGIGESLAREMTAYRERRRAFRSVEELREVKGIGEKKYRSVKPFFTVKPSP